MPSAWNVSKIIRVMINPKASLKSLQLSRHQRLVARDIDLKLGLDVFSDTQGSWNATKVSLVVGTSLDPWMDDVHCSVYPKVRITAAYVTVLKLY